MHLLILIIGVMLSPKAIYALKCYACGDGTPAEHCYYEELGKEIDCPGSHHCAGLVVTAHNMEPYPSGKGYNMKNCLPADQCVSGTVYFGNQHFYENMKCCSTDLCNVKYTDDNSDSFVKNGRKCYTCTNPKDCSNTQTALSCVGDQDRCISVVEHNDTRIGCATESMCGDVQALLNMLMNISLSEDSTISCCEGDLCNSVNIVDPTNIKPAGLQDSPSHSSLAPGSNSAVSLLILVVAPVMLASLSW